MTKEETYNLRVGDVILSHYSEYYRIIKVNQDYSPYHANRKIQGKCVHMIRCNSVGDIYYHIENMTSWNPYEAFLQDKYKLIKKNLYEEEEIL